MTYATRDLFLGAFLWKKKGHDVKEIKWLSDRQWEIRFENTDQLQQDLREFYDSRDYQISQDRDALKKLALTFKGGR